MIRTLFLKSAPSWDSAKADIIIFFYRNVGKERLLLFIVIIHYPDNTSKEGNVNPAKLESFFTISRYAHKMRTYYTGNLPGRVIK